MAEGLINFDPENDFEQALVDMLMTSRAKRKDYAGDDHPWQNFYDSGYQIGLTAGHSIEQLIATKQARLRVLLPAAWSGDAEGPKNEGIEDTLLDRAVYSVIAMCLWREGGYKKEEQPWQTS